jgi:hypothetical protein
MKVKLDEFNVEIGTLTAKAEHAEARTEIEYQKMFEVLEENS